MDSDTHTQRVALDLRRGLERLRRGEPAAAVPHLTAVVEDGALRAAADLQDILAKATSLLAQAHLELEDLGRARSYATDALALCRSLSDGDGTREIEGLVADFAAAERAQDQRDRTQRSMETLARTDTETLRRQYGKDPLSLAEILLKKSGAELEGGRHESARSLSEQVLNRACREGWRRQEVLARMSLARIDPTQAQEQLTEAWRRAERDNDHTLVATVARAASIAGVALPSQFGPDMNSEVGDP